MSVEERVLARIPEVMPELVELLRELVRIPTVNPPGENYEACAHAIGDAYRKHGHEVTYVVADGHPDHSAKYPRVNVLGRLEGAAPGRCVHFNGHLDVVPAGDGWTVDPFGGVVSDGKVWGRGTADMKAGIVCSLFAVEAIRRAGVKLSGAVEQSATVDEESGGFAGVAYLAEKGYLARGKQDHVIITEPLDPDRICLGHRGVYWFDVVVHGRIAHGSMPFLGESAIMGMGRVLSAFEKNLAPRLGSRTTALPVVPDGARHATLNVNAIAGGQSIDATQTPCVADRCTAIFDRRFLDEEPLDDVRREIAEMVASTGVRHEILDRMIVHPTTTSPGAAVVGALEASIHKAYGRAATLVASPGTYDQKHFARLAGIVDSVAYGPGILDLAHQPDEHVTLANLEKATEVMALSVVRLLAGSST